MSFTENMAQLRHLLSLESMDRVVDLLPELFDSLRADIGDSEGPSAGGAPYWQQTPVEITVGPNDIDTIELLDMNYDNYSYVIHPVSENAEQTTFYVGLPYPDVTPIKDRTRLLIKLGDVSVPPETEFRVFLVGDMSGYAPIFDPSRSFAFRTTQMYPNGYVDLVWDSSYGRWVVEDTKSTSIPLIYGSASYSTQVGVGGMNYIVIPDMTPMSAVVMVSEDWDNPFTNTELTIFLPNGKIGQRLTLTIEEFESIGEGGGSIFLNSSSGIVNDEFALQTVTLTASGYTSLVLDFVQHQDQTFWKIVSSGQFSTVGVG